MDSGNCILGLREILHTLSPKEQKLTEFIIDHPENVSHMNIEQLAETTDTSVSTIMRFCKRIGLSGYKDLCRRLYAHNMTVDEQPLIDNIHPGDDLGTIVRSTCQNHINAIENTMKLVDLAELEKAVSVLCDAQRIEFYGIGSSGVVAGAAALKFSMTGKISSYHPESASQLLSALTLTKRDAAVLISHSGESASMIDLAKRIRQNEATMISVSRYGKNSLNMISDIHLYSVASEHHSSIGVMSSRIAQLTIINILYAAVCSRMYETVKPHIERGEKAFQEMKLPKKNR